jgi:hypothetical protein
MICPKYLLLHALIVFMLCSSTGLAQRYSQTTGANLELEFTDGNGVKVKATSREVKLDLSQDKSNVGAILELSSLESINFIFLDLIERSGLSTVDVNVPILNQDYLYQSWQNKQITLDANVRINGFEKEVPMHVTFTNMKTNDVNTFSVIAICEFKLSDFDLLEYLPKYQDLAEFQFTVTLREIYR